MLRGTGSLQDLLGKSVRAKRRKTSGPAANGSGRTPLPAAQVAGPPAAVVNPAGAAVTDQQQQATPSVPDRPESPLKAGHVRCPVCQRQLRDDDGLVNTHIDQCLSKPKPRKSAQLQQASMLQFTQRISASVVEAPVSTTCQSQQQQQQQHQQPGLQLGTVLHSYSTAVTAVQATFTAPKAASSHRQQQQQEQQKMEQVKQEQQVQPAGAAMEQTPPRAVFSPGCSPNSKSSSRLMRSSTRRRSLATKDELLCFPTCVVGRSFQAAAGCSVGQRLLVEPEEGNPRDANALRVVCQSSRAVLGHIPYLVSRHLGPLLRPNSSGGRSGSSRGQPQPQLPPAVVAEAVVSEVPSSDKAPVLVEMQITIRADATGSSPGGRGKAAAAGSSPGPAKVKAALERARAAAAAHLAQQQQQPSTTGGRLSQNFGTLLGHVQQQDGHLLAEQEEQRFISTYQGLSVPSQCLFLRLFLRKGPWFRLEQLQYAEVPEIEGAAEELEDAGLAQLSGVEAAAPAAMSAPAAAAAAGEVVQEAGSGARGQQQEQERLSWQELAEMLPVRDLLAVATCAGADAAWLMSGGRPPATREALLRVLGTHAQRAPGCAARLEQCLLDGTGPLLRLSGWACACMRRLQLLFFLNGHQSLSQFLACDVGAVRYPPYALSVTRSAFASRAQLLEYERALEHAEQLTVALEEGDYEAAEAAVQPAWEALDSNRHKQDDVGPARPAPTVAPGNHAEGPGSSDGGRSRSAANESGHGSTDSDWSADDSSSANGGIVVGSGGGNAAAAGVGPGGRSAREAESSGEAEPPLFLQRFQAAWVYCMMATAGVSLLEKQRRHQEAVHRLQQLLGGRHCPARRGGWWERLCINLESHLSMPVDALEMAEAALADCWLSHGDRLALRRRVLRLGKPPRRWKKPSWASEAMWEPPEVRIEARPLTSATGFKSVFLGLDGQQQLSVEELALQHYASQAGGCWEGMHSEGGIWATLFGLLMWDVLLLPVPDVFRHPFQTAPLDLDTDAFFPARKDAIEACLERIARGDAPAMLAATWQAHVGTFCRGVNWERHSLADLQLIAECIGGPGLAAVCRLLAEDHAGWSGGMPDLLLWRPAQRQAMLSEVKGPRDRLSDQQRAWAYALTCGGLHVEVLKVVEPAGAGNRNSKKK